MRKLFAASLCAAALTLTAGCPDRNLCEVAPACEGANAINCISSCSVGPCSTGGQSHTCAEAEVCEVISGPRQSLRFNPARAVCAVNPTPCDPATAPPPQCDGQDNLSGCSGYNRVITVPCSQAGIYFDSSACCTTGINPDAGVTTDAGTDGGVDGGR